MEGAHECPTCGQPGVFRDHVIRSLVDLPIVGHPEMDRSIKAMPTEGKPAVIMVVGVNGTGKTTTTPGSKATTLLASSHCSRAAA